jgi:hypothetical protein
VNNEILSGVRVLDFTTIVSGAVLHAAARGYSEDRIAALYEKRILHDDSGRA